MYVCGVPVCICEGMAEILGCLWVLWVSVAACRCTGVHICTCCSIVVSLQYCSTAASKGTTNWALYMYIVAVAVAGDGAVAGTA